MSRVWKNLYSRLTHSLRPSRVLESEQPVSTLPTVGTLQADEMNLGSSTPLPSEWHVLQATEAGAAHDRHGLPNQDAITCSWGPNESLPIILAVADGHGGSKYFRSDQGSKLAVATAAEVIDGFMHALKEDNNAAFDETTLKMHAPKGIIKRWVEQVRAHLQLHPIESEELNRLDPKERDEFLRCGTTYSSLIPAGDTEAQALTDEQKSELQIAEAKLIQAYGATLLVVAVTERYLLYWQLGDGDILNVASDGSVSRAMPEDDRLFANETTSLCTGNAWKDFRMVLQSLPEEAEKQPALIMLSTDGYANSYSSAQGFEKVGSDLLRMMRENDGLASVENGLSGWLKETSAGGSGDDITAGIILRLSALKELPAEEATEPVVEELGAEPETDSVAAGVQASIAGDTKTPAIESEVSPNAKKQ